MHFAIVADQAGRPDQNAGVEQPCSVAFQQPHQGKAIDLGARLAECEGSRTGYRFSKGQGLFQTLEAVPAQRAFREDGQSRALARRTAEVSLYRP